MLDRHAYIFTLYLTVDTDQLTVYFYRVLFFHTEFINRLRDIELIVQVARFSVSLLQELGGVHICHSSLCW